MKKATVLYNNIRGITLKQTAMRQVQNPITNRVTWVGIL